MSRTWTPRLLALTAVVTMAVSAGCSASGERPALTVSPATSRFDQPVDVRVTGLEPRAAVVVSVTATDANGVAWSGHATYRADNDGKVNTNTAASSAGTYTGARAMGLVSSMQPPSDVSKDAGVFVWPRTTVAFAWSATIDGRQVAKMTAPRSLDKAGERHLELTKADAGIVGTYVAVPDGHRHPAVLTLGGSEGGHVRTIAAALAAHGIPTLSQAYFKEPGLPQQLSRIPLETFDKGLAWLRRQPEVDPDRVWIIGGSRGSEAALLEANRRPDLVAGVVVGSPNSLAGPEFPIGPQSAWTVGGKPIPFSPYDASQAPPDSPANIAVDRIDGPVLAICGGNDTLWSSCAAGNALMARLDASKNAKAHQLLSYREAGHYVNILLPYFPISQATYREGTDRLADDAARADAWPKVVAEITGG